MLNDSSSVNVIISDTSCIASLSNIGQLDLLKKLYGHVTITPEVFEEFSKKNNEILPGWIGIKEAKNKDKINNLKNVLGAGEFLAIILASETPFSLVIIDDRKAREYALALGLNVIGTVGVIRQAADRNIIKNHEKANELFHELKNKGFWLNNKLINEIKYPVNSEENKAQKSQSEQPQPRTSRR
jgi:predicted nucleic acid-binding protein